MTLISLILRKRKGQIFYHVTYIMYMWHLADLGNTIVETLQEKSNHLKEQCVGSVSI